MSSDEAAFLAAIRAFPEEDTPRLVYADWLQEQGREERAAHPRADRKHRAADPESAVGGQDAAGEEAKV